jgi:lysozyme family protein
MISKYNDFILENEFNSIVFEFFKLVEDVEGKWTGSNTMEWDYTDSESDIDYNDRDELTDAIIDFGDKALNKLRDFLKKLPKEKIKEYFVKLINKFKSLPIALRRKLIGSVTGVFLTFVSLSYLVGGSTDSGVSKSGLGLSKEQTEEVISIAKKEQSTVKAKASFEKAQGLVKLAEAGYSNDRGDNGNYIDVPGGRRFIGTNHGISAPILEEYFKKQGIKRLLTKEDMMDLSYETALKIYKADYWDAQSLGSLESQDVANIIYDGCVNQGIDAMRTIMRKALEDNGIEIKNTDIIFSNEILSKANKLNQEDLFNSIKDFREERYRESETFKRHGEGWLNRLNDISYDGENNNDVV